MASIVNYVADGATNQFQIPFTYINQADVVVTVNGTTPTFTFVNSTTINIASTPASGDKVIVKRVTPVTALVDFTDGSTLFEADLDLAHLQNRLIAEESRERADNAIDTLNANILNINTVAGIEANVTTVAGNTTNINSIATNMAEVLNADTNAATATTKAGEASASASTASAQATISTTKAGESSTSAAEALASKNAASASESASSTSETNSANSATSSANSASASGSSASSASASQTVATTKAAEAVVSANNSAVSATNSANSATTATTKANEASASQSAAATSEANALSSKNAAATSETNAATSETNAATSETNAASSEAVASTKASEASTSATNAASSETNASNSATTATTQAGIATTKAAEAAASATSIGNAETTTTANAVAAANSAAAAATALDSFDDRYLGVKSSDPSVDNDGNALAQGALYFSSSSSAMQVYDGANWIAASSSGVASLTLFEYTATAGQTAFTGSDDNGLSMSFIAANLLVTMNGVILDPSDFTTSGGVTVTLGTGAAVGDIVNIYAFKSFQVSDTVSASTGGTFAGAVSFSNGATVTGTVAATSYTGDGSALTGTGSPSIVDNGNATAMTITSDENIGIGTSSPSAPLTVKAPADAEAIHVVGRSDDIGQIKFMEADGTTELGLIDARNSFFNIGSIANIPLKFATNNSERMRIGSSGDVMVGQTAGDVGGGHLTSGIKLDSSGYIDTAKASGFAIRANRQTTEGDIIAINYNGSPIGALGSADTYHFAVESKFSDKNIEFKVNKGGSTATVAQFYGSTGAKSFGSFESFSGGYNLYAGAGSAASYAMRMDAPGTGSAGILQVVNGYGQVGSIRVNGASTYFFTSSDYRLKTDVQPMTGASARVQALNPVNFEWIADGNRTDGFLAHEAQEVVPEAVVGDKDAMRNEPYEVTPAVLDDDGNITTEAVMGERTIPDHQSIDQSKLVPLLTAALQEALTEIASLKTRVQALEDV